MNSNPWLDATAGVTEMSIAMLQRTDNELTGIYANFFIYSIKKMKVNVTYDDMPVLSEIGECFANDKCTHQLALLRDKIPQQDFQLMGQPTNYAKFVNDPPILYGPVFVSNPSYILSRPDRVGQSTNMDVSESLLAISPGVATLFLFWMLIAWLISVQLRKCIYRGRYIRDDDFLWDILRAFCDQDYFESRYGEPSSISILGVLVVMSAFWLNQFYFGNFGTELTLTPEPFKINSLRDLVGSGTPASFWYGDSTFEHEFRDRRGSQVRSQVYEMHMRAPLRFLMEPEDTRLAVNVLGNCSYALIGPEPTLNLVNLLRCMDEVAGEELNPFNKSKMAAPYHFSRDLVSDPVRAIIYHCNISLELRARLDWGFHRLFESHVTYKAIIDDLAPAMAAVFMTTWTNRLRMCAARELIPAESSWNPFAWRNVAKLFRAAALATVLALLAVAAEVITKKFCERKVRIRTSRWKSLKPKIVTSHFL